MTPASLFSKLIVWALTLSIAFIYIFVNFKGLTTADGMEKSQLAREVSRGAYKTKIIRPIAMHQYSKKHDRPGFLKEVASADSYNSPLYPLILGGVFKLIDAGSYEKWKMNDSESVYKLDRVVCGMSVLFFLLSAIMASQLARKMFDETIAGFTFILLVSCELFWKLAQTGMPNCLMLLLFTTAMYCLYIATDHSNSSDKNGFVYGSIAGILLVLLCMCHWMGLWLLLGFLIYSFFFIRPMGGVSATTLVVALAAFAFPVNQNLTQTGNPFGTAFFSLYTGLGLSDEVIMRAGDSGDVYIAFRDLAFNFLKNAFRQISVGYEYAGYVVVIPFFFLSVIHYFRNPTVNTFRWGVLILWFCAVLGMSVYGLGDDAMHSNQLHYLFTPIMIAYGLSIIAIFWKRLPLSNSLDGVWEKSHFYLIALIACAPMVLAMPVDVIKGLRSKKIIPNWPPYFPSALNLSLNTIVPEESFIFSDQPWAVAWYADRNAIWTPNSFRTFQKMQDEAASHRTPIAGVHVSPSSFGSKSFYRSYLANRDLASVALDGWASMITHSELEAGDFAKKSKAGSQIMSSYPYPYPLTGGFMMYYAAERPRKRN